MSDQSFVGIVPRGEVAGLFAQFLNQSGGGKAPSGRREREAESGRREGRRRQSQRQENPRQQHRGPQERPYSRGPRPRRTLSHDLLPLWNGHQIFGDSMMLRFAGLTTSARPSFNKSLNANQLGYCVSGQTSGQLLRFMKSKQRPKMAKKAILMIGTNNILKRVPLEESKRALSNIVEELKKSTDKLIVMTIPPVPKLMKDKTAVEAIKSYNLCIKAIPNSDGIIVQDISPLFYEENTIRMELFETDQIHWTRAAMQMVAEQLKETILLS
ncbi:uncharacterized protein LOC117653398 [Thrips palmi]|uniref:Uncharacterized protein LOC117653398 n=1 Tax=Thrips palmi TaxID=161013 RepID=A0A6P9AC43_THRPL|nr:uncharacterized protein LOC117653398 [Thrips palmi]